MNPKPQLPVPDAISAAHSDRVAAHIRSIIDRAGGSVPFSTFMQEALYAPGLGYYTAGTRKFGPDGDFVTAPEVSSLFGRVLARQVAQVFETTGERQVLELGEAHAATGRRDALHRYSATRSLCRALAASGAGSSRDGCT